MNPTRFLVHVLKQQRKADLRAEYQRQFKVTRTSTPGLNFSSVPVLPRAPFPSLPKPPRTPS
jgi:hypothetical protein